MEHNVTRRISSKVLTVAAAALLLGLGSSTVRAQSITIGNVSGAAGSTVQIPVIWENGAADDASGLTVDLTFEESVDSTASMRPACTFNSAVTAVKEASSFSFRPPQCAAAGTCTQVRAGIISFNPDNNPLPVPEGEIYTCAFTIPSGANEGDTFDFTIAASGDASYINPAGTETDIPLANVTNGVVTVGGEEPTVPAATATSTPGTGVTPTPGGENTRTRTPATPGSGGGGGGDDDGCNVVAPADASAAWLLLIPAAMLLVQRRRSR